MLKPVEQFICDTCHEVIQKPEDGCLEWVTGEDMRAYDFRICHHETHSTLKRTNDCYEHAEKDGRTDLSLKDRHGLMALPLIYGFLNGGHSHDPEVGELRVRDLNEFLEIARRLTIPYYEEARRYWSEAYNDYGFHGMGDEAIYDAEHLIRIIKTHSLRD